VTGTDRPIPAADLPATPGPDGLDAPAWFTQALAEQASEATVLADGVRICYRAWGNAGPGGIVLVHGGAAHSRWWDHVAPLLTQGRPVVAVDLSGHGDSDRREKYTLDHWAHEVVAVAADAGLTDTPVVVGHSMGGAVALRAAGLYGADLAGIVVIDTPVHDLSPEDRAAMDARAFGPLRIYPSREAAIARFRPIPDQPILPYVRAHVAATSIHAVQDGWTWKFDPRIFGRAQSTELLHQLACRVALFHAEHGIVPPQTAELMYDKLGRRAPVIDIPAAGHHVMLDHPIALVTGIRALLSDWDHSLPARP
jgi:pimeloyl-ACP methyl ester carboxylesterase